MPIVVDKKVKREKILDAAIKVFSQKGRSSTKISDLAERAGIGKGTVYEYFQSKDEVFAASFYHFMEKFEEVISRRLFRIQDPLKKLRVYFSAWTEILEGDYLDYLEIVLDFWAEGVRKGDDSWKIDLSRFYAENVSVLDSLLAECVARGEVKPVDTTLIASTMLGALDGLLIQWVFNRDAFEIRMAVDLFVDTMIDGLKRKA